MTQATRVPLSAGVRLKVTWLTAAKGLTKARRIATVVSGWADSMRISPTPTLSLSQAYVAPGPTVVAP
ncbi:hypothetical protein D3C71_1924510 [compost metagenome]